MWTILNSHAKSIVAGTALSLIVAISFATTSFAADDKATKPAKGKHAITIKAAQVVTLDAKQQAKIYGKSSVRTLKQDNYVIKVETQDPVNLLMSSSPVITVNGKEVLTKFEPHQATTFYAFVDKKLLNKGSNSIDMTWPDLPKAAEKRHKYQLELK